ncbi:MAG: hypothetical protein C4547_06140 [Phycisphaerales bacterium]|nr:MAG: hypothetical protein C4547_06140 [Phycisphaerales bacterium]
MIEKTSMTDQRTQHSVAELPRPDHGASNDALARALSITMQRQYDVAARYIGADDGRRPGDAWIEVDGQRILVEFCAYVQQDGFHELERADRDALGHISRACLEANCPIMAPHISWQSEPKKMSIGFSTTTPRVPRGADLEGVSVDFVRLAKRAAADPRLHGHSISVFDEVQSGAVREYPNGDVGPPASVYPRLSRYCLDVRLDSWQHTGRPAFRSNFNSRMLYIDMEELNRNVQSKVHKIEQYRASAAGSAVWLVVHMDGSPPSRKLPEPQRPKAMASIASTAGTLFDRVFWAEWLLSEDAARLFCVFDRRVC